ncbi:ABC-2 family transporter [Natranaerovirga hydrolytica]|uniref:ABC-2 family transporter n=1 Tax=Natranaerovirga hydrolytica TaxID=680378 RepID=A0A4R1ME94_9FIRM|nr:ABC-2 transporter permease [Natranaerovirga hydrolytica]TCK90525.1 ABC-2 family transporter [Natranaerovirga hydrolytica]
MKGLLLNNFYSMSSNIKLSIIVAIAMVFFPAIGGRMDLLPVAIGIQIFTFVANTGTSLQADETSKWSKFELTLPIKRKTIINAKYISFILLILMGILFSIMTPWFFYLTNGELSKDLVRYGYSFGLVLAIASTALMYPLTLKIGVEKSELIMFLSAGLSIGLMLLIAFVLSDLTNGMNLRDPLVGIVSVMVSLVLFIISYGVSLIIHKNKEF